MKLSKKTKKQFNKLSEEEKLQIVDATINTKINEAISKGIAKAFIEGSRYELEHLYNTFVVPIDEIGITEKEREMRITMLLSKLRKTHLIYVQNTQKGGEK